MIKALYIGSLMFIGSVAGWFIGSALWDYLNR